jgi:hypothetical protein
VPYAYSYYIKTVHGAELPGQLVLWAMNQFPRHQDSLPISGDPAALNTETLKPQILMEFPYRDIWAGIPAEDRTTIRNTTYNTAIRKWTSIACGDEPNGSTTITIGDWSTRANRFPHYFYWDGNINAGGGSNGFANAFWAAIVHGRATGLDLTTQNRLVTCAGERFNGPSRTLDSNGIATTNQTSFSFASNPGSWINWPGDTASGGVNYVHRMQVGTEQIECSTRVGATLSGCTRGVNGTTAQTHAAGATVQFVIRWANARDQSSCSFNGDNLTIASTCWSAMLP